LFLLDLFLLGLVIHHIGWLWEVLNEDDNVLCAAKSLMWLVCGSRISTRVIRDAPHDRRLSWWHAAICLTDTYSCVAIHVTAAIITLQLGCRANRCQSRLQQAPRAPCCWCVPLQQKRQQWLQAQQQQHWQQHTTPTI
jgi:hypothetical protein